MEVVATRHLLNSLLAQMQAQTGHNVEHIRRCMHDAFDALVRERGIDFKTVAQAHCSFEQLTTGNLRTRTASTHIS